MSKRSIQKVRHYAPTPTVKERVKSGHNGISLIALWHDNLPRYKKEKVPFIVAQEESNER